MQQLLVHLPSIISRELHREERRNIISDGQPWKNILIKVIFSFSIPFYLLEKKWFIDGDLSYTYLFHEIIFTIPFVFVRFTTEG
jgi:hypothetical protein